MTTLTLIIHLITGATIFETASPAECRELITVARVAEMEGNILSRDLVPVAAITCGDEAIVLLLPESAGDCEVMS